MNVKTRLATVILAGILVGLIAVRLQKQPGSLDRALVSYDDATRRNALASLQSLNDDAKRSNVIGALSGSWAKNQDPRIRTYALYALRKSGWNGPRVVSSMVNGLQDKDENVRREANVGIMEIGPAGLGAMVGMMSDPAIRGVASDLVRTLPPESIPQLAQMLAQDATQQRGAAFIVSKLQRPETISAAAPLLPALSAMLKSTDTVLATNAAFALHTLDPKDTRPADVFLASLKQINWDAWDVRGWDALDALTKLPSVSSRTIPLLRGILPAAQDGLMKNMRFKRPAIGNALATLAPRDSSISSRAADMKSKDAVIRWRAVYEVSQMPTVDPQYLAALVGLLNDTDKAIEARAFYALDRMGLKNTERASAEIYPKLIATFQNVKGGEVPAFLMVAAAALAGLGQPIAPPMLTAVKEGKLDPQKASWVFRCMSAELAPTAALTQALKSENSDVRVVAAMGLSLLAPQTSGVREELQKQSVDRRPPFKDEIDKALSQMSHG